MNIRPPTDNRGRKVATFDPNYQTLAGLNNDDVFKPKVIPINLSTSDNDPFCSFIPYFTKVFIFEVVRDAI